MSKSYRYIIDVTQLIRWVGNLTGIPRVTDELARRFAKLDDAEVVFVSWEPKINKMRIVDLETELANRKVIIEDLPHHDTHDDDDTDTLPRRNTFIRLVRFALKLPSLTKAKLFASTGLSDSLIWRSLRSFKWHMRHGRPQLYKPTRGDRFLIVWGEWDSDKYIDQIVRYGKTGVDIYPMAQDMLPVVVPQFNGDPVSFKKYCGAVYPIAKTIIAISQHTRSDVIEWLKSEGLGIPPIKVIRLGEELPSRQRGVVKPTAMQDKFHVGGDDYILCVGTIEARKNHTLLYYVYKLAHARGIDLPQLLIVGRPGFHTNEIRDYIKKDPEVNDKMRICYNVADDELAWLYENCLFTVIPSFYEGWGLPIVESITYGSPCVCSNTSSMTEIAEDNVLHFSPSSVDECMAAIQEMLKPKTLAEYRKRARSYKVHSWDDSFEQVLAIMESNDD